MGGSGGSFSWSNPSELSQKIRKAELAQAETEFVPKLQNLLDTYLASVTSRDVEGTRTKIEIIKACLGDELELSPNMLFGGSVAKHTYVDGLSDVDVLCLLKNADAEKERPSKLLGDMTKALTDRLDEIGAKSVRRGTIAITIEYDDGTEIQIIPAAKSGNRMLVPRWEGDAWSKIDPDGFRRKLTKVNQDCANKLVPTIKLVKAINSTLPEKQRLSGYHIEALAVAAFRDYEGPHVTYKMLPTFYQKARELVKSPLRDSSGQSLYVDEYMGPKDSAERKQSSFVFDRIARRMENATAAYSLSQWRSFFDD